jgi:hypothetical protein
MLTQYKKAKLNPEEVILEKQRGTRDCGEDEEYYQYDISDYIKYCTDDTYYATCEFRPDNHNEDSQGEFERVPLSKQLISVVKKTALYPEAVLKSLESSISRKHLNLTASKITPEDINKYVVPFLKKNPDITDLNLDGNSLGDRGVIPLSRIALNKLNLSFNKLTDAGAIAIAKNTNLHTLIITNNKIGDKGAMALAVNPGLKILDISDNKIGNKGGAALATNSMLESLDVFDQKMGIQGTRAFLFNETLKFLRIRLFADENLQRAFQIEIPRMRKEKNEKQKMAFLMGIHPKAGEGSPILPLYRYNEKLLLREILTYIEPVPFRLQSK